jgi:hypothetical protein
MSDIDYKSAAEECARYIYDSDSEQISYQEYIESGNDPRDHILYHASIILGEDKEEFEWDINFYLKESGHNSDKNLLTRPFGVI